MQKLNIFRRFAISNANICTRKIVFAYIFFSAAGSQSGSQVKMQLKSHLRNSLKGKKSAFGEV